MLQNKQTHVLTLSNRNPHLKSQLGIKMPLAVKTREEVSKVVDWRSGRRGEYNSVIFFLPHSRHIVKERAHQTATTIKGGQNHLHQQKEYCSFQSKPVGDNHSPS